MRSGDLGGVRWIHGAPDCDDSDDPPLQVVAVDDDTFVIRQSKCVHFEAPFLYLLVGSERALLHDTGATEDAELFPIRRTVDDLIGGRQLELIVTHSHGHGDHRAGDAQFTDLPVRIDRPDRRGRRRGVLRDRGLAGGRGGHRSG